MQEKPEALKAPDERFVIVAGTITEGVIFHGPFDDPDDASDCTVIFSAPDQVLIASPRPMALLKGANP